MQFIQQIEKLIWTIIINFPKLNWKVGETFAWNVIWISFISWSFPTDVNYIFYTSQISDRSEVLDISHISLKLCSVISRSLKNLKTSMKRTTQLPKYRFRIWNNGIHNCSWICQYLLVFVQFVLKERLCETNVLFLHPFVEWLEQFAESLSESVSQPVSHRISQSTNESASQLPSSSLSQSINHSESAIALMSIEYDILNQMTMNSSESDHHLWMSLANCLIINRIKLILIISTRWIPCMALAIDVVR
jgi:hypothetical protein